MAVLPAHPVVQLPGLANHLEDLTSAAGFSNPVPCDLDHIPRPRTIALARFAHLTSLLPAIVTLESELAIRPDADCRCGFSRITGGVDAATLAGYLAVPSVVACAGSWLVKLELLREEHLDEVERLAREASELAR